MSEYNKEDIKNLHYNNNNEIQYEYGGQIYHCSMEHLKEVLVTCWNLQQENKILKENAENNDKVVDKVNWENQLLKKENKQLKDNWNELKKWLEEESKLKGSETAYLYYGNVQDKMQELEQESDSNENN